MTVQVNMDPTDKPVVTPLPAVAPASPKRTNRSEVSLAIGQLVLLLGLPAAVYFALKARMIGIAVGAGVAYLVFRFLIRRRARREERAIQADEATDSDTSSGEVAMGCIGILILPVVLVCAGIALKYDLPWVGWMTVAGLAVYLLFKIRFDFRIPDRTPEGIVGGRPRDAVAAPPQVVEHLLKSGLLNESESLVAGVDDSWTDNGTRGTLITDGRILRYRDSAILLSFALEDVNRLFIRKMWYPRAGFMGRGEFSGQGPVVVLRMKCRLKDGSFRRMRFSTYANQLYPFVSALLERLGDRVVVRRTLPGI